MRQNTARVDDGLTGRAEHASAPVRVLLADDHPLMLIGIRHMLESYEDIEVVGQAQSGPEMMALIERRAPDMVLTDLRMPGFEGVDSITEITTRWPNLKVVVLSACEDRAEVNAALVAGASAYIVKSARTVDIASVLRQANSGAVFHAPSVLRAASAGHPEDLPAPGGPVLTEREATILCAVARGLTTKRISADLWVSEHTIKFHLTNIYRKLGVANRSGAVRYAIEHGLAA
jgi:NarL family two-component system response regulator LiaR